MKKDWFVLHALTGQENKARDSIVARAKLEEMGEYVGECLVPTERVTETKNGKKRTLVKKRYPGYVFVQLALYDEGRAADQHGRRPVIERTWQFLRETPGVIGFIGGQHPMPMRPDEVAAITGEGEEARPAVPVHFDFNVNDTVKVKDGPFKGLTGLVTMVDPDKGKLKVEVAIFNRKVQVDVEHWQVEKASVEDLIAENAKS